MKNDITDKPPFVYTEISRVSLSSAQETSKHKSVASIFFDQPDAALECSFRLPVKWTSESSDNLQGKTKVLASSS